eukprot:SAG11_NODE_5088_length_1667_cov_1.860332_2_plen_30_part_01
MIRTPFQSAIYLAPVVQMLLSANSRVALQY